jgi:hypothetical protein
VGGVRYLLVALLSLVLCGAAQAQDIYLVPKKGVISATTLRSKLPAFQQNVRDVESLWGYPRTLTPVTLKVASRPPAGAWRVRFTKPQSVSYEGFHWENYQHVPYALILHTRTWTVTLSHEIEEMMIDPYPSTRPSVLAGPYGYVYLVEIADPVEADTYFFGQVELSDFVTQEWYTTPPLIPNRRYDFLGHVQWARECLLGGYYSILQQGEWDQVFC